jgi:ligand-binding SRPBCC domain-containing protein
LKRTKTVTVTSVFSAPPDEIWERLTRVETLQYIAAPFASFSPVDPDKEMVWREGETSQFRLRIFGFLPVGVHTIQVCRFDYASYTIDTQEGNKSVPIWNHRITISQAGKNASRYTDDVELGAGWLTGVVYIWSKMFYQHRQRRWVKLLEKS